MEKSLITVIGASAGGVEALKQVVGCFPEMYPGSVFIVLHVSPRFPSILPDILAQHTKCRVVHPEDGEVIRRGTIYVAPPDYHLILEQNAVLVRHGPRENRARPSIDVLFRSAAYVYRSLVTGIVLSGTLHDGISGMWAIKRLGGVTIVQDPREAKFNQLPENILEYVKVDYIGTIRSICHYLDTHMAMPRRKEELISKDDLERIRMEVDIAKEENGFEMGILGQGRSTSLTCPECHGSLIRMEEGKLSRYRCHTGHAYTPGALLASISDAIEEGLWNSVRAMEESVLLLKEMKSGYADAGDQKSAKLCAGEESRQRFRADALRKVVFTTKTGGAGRRAEIAKGNGVVQARKSRRGKRAKAAA